MAQQEKIGEVVLDYEYYDEKEHYSDGDVEDILLDAAQNDTMEELLHTSNDWAILYHCSNIRQNLLEWYPFKENASLLEIGSGCGALTGLFSRKVATVTCIELSKRRSLINAYRNKNCSNVKIMVGNFERIPITEKYDYITLIGVWEYAESYISEPNPYLEMLRMLKQHLKKDGKLLIAIENKMGIKYWNGAVEDHTGEMYSGLNDYIDCDKGVRTFSRPEIECMLKEAGWSSCKFYYPMPDYKLPDVIFSDERLPMPGEIRNYRRDYNAARVYHFYDAVICDQICSDNMISYFSNSFLVECGDSFGNVIYAKYNRIRRKEFDISTRIVKKDKKYYVEKTALQEEAEAHLEQMKKYAKARFCGLGVLDGKLEGNSYIVSYIAGKDMSSLFYQYRNDIALFIQKTKEVIETYFEPDDSEWIDFELTEGYRNVFGEKYVESAKCLSLTNIDLNFSNIRISEGGEAYCIDNEWVFDFPIPYEYVLWRAVSQLYSQYMIYLKKHISRQDFITAVGINKDNCEIYREMESSMDKKVCRRDYRKNYKKQALMYGLRFV